LAEVCRSEVNDHKDLFTLAAIADAQQLLFPPVVNERLIRIVNDGSPWAGIDEEKALPRAEKCSEADRPIRLFLVSTRGQ
jgi:hypothetical protein